MEISSFGRNLRKMQSIPFAMLMATLFLSADRLRADIAVDTSCPASPEVASTMFFFKAGPTGGSCLPGHNGTTVNWKFLTIITKEDPLKTSPANYPCVVDASVSLFSTCRVSVDTGTGIVTFDFSNGRGVGIGSEFDIDLQNHSPLLPRDGFWSPFQLFSVAASDTGFVTPLPLTTTDPYLPLDATPEPSYLAVLILMIGALVVYRRAGGRPRETT